MKKAPFYHVANFQSKTGTWFTSFAKHDKFGKDLYSDFVAPMLKANLLVESWPNGPGVCCISNVTERVLDYYSRNAAVKRE